MCSGSDDEVWRVYRLSAFIDVVGRSMGTGWLPIVLVCIVIVPALSGGWMQFRMSLYVPSHGNVCFAID